MACRQPVPRVCLRETVVWRDSGTGLPGHLAVLVRLQTKSVYSVKYSCTLQEFKSFRPSLPPARANAF